MAWTVENRYGLYFDKETGWLRTSEGDNIAAFHECPDGRLEISLGMDTNFRWPDGSLQPGWVCEEHILSLVTLREGEGTLEYQEGRCTDHDWSKPTLSIRVTRLILIPPAEMESKKSPMNWLSRFFKKAA